MPRIDGEVLDVLQGVECEDDKARITQQLDRPLYLKVSKVLTALGGKWNRKAQATIFTGVNGDPAVAAEIIGDAVTAGEYVDPKKEFQFFETPPDVGQLLVNEAIIEPGMTALEPSAGRGALAVLMRDAGASVECIELHDEMADYLHLELGFATTAGDFLEVEVPTPGIMKEAGKKDRYLDPRVDRVVMNPPFAKSQDILHVQRAYQWLKPGGRLVSVMGSGVTFRGDQRATEFREWLHDLGGDFIKLPPQSFRPSGTDVCTVYIVVDKPE